MKKENAIKFLKKLHELEDLYRCSLLDVDKLLLLEQIRFDFLKAYQGK